jgi:hypothetical protein
MRLEAGFALRVPAASPASATSSSVPQIKMMSKIASFPGSCIEIPLDKDLKGAISIDETSFTTR